MKDAVALFFAMRTQWRWTGAGMAALRTGLDYGALASTAALSGVTMTDSIFHDIRTLEETALEVWSRKHV